MTLSTVHTEEPESPPHLAARGPLDRLMQAGRMALPREILIVNVTPAIGAHVGPDGLGFAAVTKLLLGGKQVKSSASRRSA